MANWTDNKGNVWHTAVTIADIKRVKALTGCDLLTAYGGKLADTMAEDPVLLGDVLYALHKPEADKAGIDDVAFGEGLAGDAIGEAVNAMMLALADFFPSSQRELRRELWQKAKKTAEESEAKALAAIRGR